MSGRSLPGTALRLRRGRRGDVAKLEALLGVAPGARPVRFYRRLLADLGADVYVAEDDDGEIVGVVSLVYARSLVRGGVSALLDGARARRPVHDGVLDGLLAFAEERARRRGCARLAAWPGDGDDDLRAVLVARGYRAGALFETDLAAGAPS